MVLSSLPRGSQSSSRTAGDSSLEVAGQCQRNDLQEMHAILCYMWNHGVPPFCSSHRLCELEDSQVLRPVLRQCRCAFCVVLPPLYSISSSEGTLSWHQHRIFSPLSPSATTCSTAQPRPLPYPGLWKLHSLAQHVSVPQKAIGPELGTDLVATTRTRSKKWAAAPLVANSALSVSSASALCLQQI